MANANEAIVSKDWDLTFLATQAQISYPYAIEVDEVANTATIKFNYRDYENITAAIEDYPIAYLANAQDKARKRIGEIGREKAATFPFGGQAFPLDFTTECRLDGLCRYFERNPSFTEIHWDTSGEGDFLTISREMAFGLFDAASQHMQAVFNKRKELTDLVNAATDINDPVFSSLETNWPGDEPAV